MIAPASKCSGSRDRAAAIPVAAHRPMPYMRSMANKRNSSGSGPTQRQLRVGELIRRTLSDVLARGDVHDPELNRMSITVGEVRTSSDLKIATAYVLPLGGAGADAAIQALKRNKGELRHQIAKAMTLKFAPDLRFVIDETFDRMDETRRMFQDATVQRDIAAGRAGEDDADDFDDEDDLDDEDDRDEDGEDDTAAPPRRDEA